MIYKSDYLIDWNNTSINIQRKVLGLYPNVYTTFNSKRLIIKECETYTQYYVNLNEQQLYTLESSIKDFSSPGYIIYIDKIFGFFVSTEDQPILIRITQLEGKRSSSGITMIQQLKINIGDKLGDM